MFAELKNQRKLMWRNYT